MIFFSLSLCIIDSLGLNYLPFELNSLDKLLIIRFINLVVVLLSSFIDVESSTAIWKKYKNMNKL